jgi:hypothetical protein
LIRSPIHKVLSTLCTHSVRYLLMGGQACIFYGAAEFSRDCDIALLCEPDNLARLQEALDDLEAECIAVPPFEPGYLLRGHAVHFRCRATGVEGMRLDVMAQMRGVAPFAELWERRTTIDDPTGTAIEVMSLPDLVAAKKTQRDKDWPMIRRLVEAHFSQHQNEPTAQRVRFWLGSSRTPDMLIQLAGEHPELTGELVLDRPLLAHALESDHAGLERALAEEQESERAADRAYWDPLRKELERLRHERK